MTDELGRRGFVRNLGREALRTAAMVAEGSSHLRDLLADAAADQPTTTAAPSPIAAADQPTTAAAPSPIAVESLGMPVDDGAPVPAFTWEGGTVRIIVQHALPGSFRSIVCRTAEEVIAAIRADIVLAAPVMAQLSAAALAMVDGRGNETIGSWRFALDAVGTPLRYHRPSAAAVTAAIDRMLTVVDRMIDEPPSAVTDRLVAEARAIIDEAADDHRSLAAGLAAELDALTPDALQVLVLGSTGSLGGGDVGTCLEAVRLLHRTGRPISVLVAEGRPSMTGRIAAWELTRAGIRHKVIPDAACGAAIAAGVVDAILAAAECLRPDGSILTEVGARQVAASAARQRVPVLIAIPATAMSADVGSAAEAPRASATDRGRLFGFRVPVVDELPADLVTTLVVGEAGRRHETAV